MVLQSQLAGALMELGCSSSLEQAKTAFRQKVPLVGTSRQLLNSENRLISVRSGCH